MIERPLDKSALTRLMALFPVTTILGPRQSGKSTLAREFAADHVFDLENPRDLALLAQPQLALEPLSGLIVIDEIQRAPDLFPLLRHLVDTRPDQRYLILGSASRDLIRNPLSHSPVGSAFTSSAAFDCPILGLTIGDGSGCGAGYHRRLRRPPTTTAIFGGSNTLPHSSNETSHNWALPFRRPPYGGSGPCSVITTGKCSTTQNSLVHSGSPI